MSRIFSIALTGSDPDEGNNRHWTKWDGAPLGVSSEPYDHVYAHKPWVVKWKGVVYHFYCAVGDQGRVIALTTSQDLRD